MQTDLALTHLPNPEQRLNAMFQAFDGLMLVLDNNGMILDYKAGNGPQLYILTQKKSFAKFQDFVPADVWQKYKNALHELRNGSKVVLFEYMLEVLKDKFWYESRLVPFADNQNIMFVRDITKYKKSSHDELTLAYDKAIESWSQALYLRDQETEDHTRRVTDMALSLAFRLGLSETDFVHIKRGSILHDVGKVAIPDNILFKTSSLTDEEWVIMRRHPLIAAEILGPIHYLAPALPIPRSHHEKWDGSGYPDGLAGESIPLFARIFAFADVYDALTSDRPYRRAWSRTEAIAYIVEQSGVHFDPSITPTFIRMISES
ncbi:MAG: HD domain-containing protein [Chloroflexi bacterium]|nr:HD domain-containing protein [Chloroflexota bacterium]